MTRTEERLRDALLASAARVRDDRLRPLPPATSATGKTATRTTHRPAWLAPVAAAASVLLIVGLALAVTGHFKTKAAPVRPTTTSEPRYYIGIATSPSSPIRIGVFAAATGKLVASVAEPSVPRLDSLSLAAAAVAPDDHTFYAEFHIVAGTTSQLKIYRFSLTSDRSATPLTLVKGGVLTGPASQYSVFATSSLAVSPDGTELAFTTNSPAAAADDQGMSDRVVAISLQTGQHTVWQGGLDRTGKVFSIQEVSWTADSQSLVYLATWCKNRGDACLDGTYADKYETAQVRELDLKNGGTLAQGRVLLTESSRYPFIADALAGPDDGDITVLVYSGTVNSSGSWSRVSIERISDTTGAVLNVDYQLSGDLGEQGNPAYGFIRSDASGQFLLYLYSGTKGTVIAALANGQFRRLLLAAAPYGW